MRSATLAGSTPTPLKQSTAQTITRQPTRPWLQDSWLWILLVGPLVAPLFMAIGWPVLRPFADGIYLLGQTVCPKVTMHLQAFGYPVAVCSSCWAAVWGLWAVRLFYGRAGEGFGPFSRAKIAPLWARWQAASVSTRLSVLVVDFMPWAFDAMMWDTGTWSSPHAFMMLAGFLGGVSAGAVLLPVASEMRARLRARRRAVLFGR